MKTRTVICGECGQPKTRIVICGECGQPHEKEMHDLDLNIGDKVIHYEWRNKPIMLDMALTIDDISHKKDGLYFGSYREPINNELVTNARVNTRDHKFLVVK